MWVKINIFTNLNEMSNERNELRKINEKIKIVADLLYQLISHSNLSILIPAKKISRDPVKRTTASHPKKIIPSYKCILIFLPPNSP